MPTGEELDAVINKQIDDDTKEMIKLVEGGAIRNGREAGKTEIVGTVAERVSSGGVSGKDVCED